LKKLQLELQSRATESQSNTSLDGSGDHAVSHMQNIKLMKLPPFHEEKDDLDAYLNRFERTCRAFNVPQGSFQLARFLQGQALDVYQRMSDDGLSSRPSTTYTATTQASSTLYCASSGPKTTQLHRPSTGVQSATRFLRP